MKILWGKEHRLWQVLRAEYARVEAERDGAERMIQTYAGTIRHLMEDLKYYREKADRAVDDLLLVRGVPPIRPDLPTETEDLLEEDPKLVEEQQRLLETHPEAAWEGSHGI
mgnify:FL=1